MGIGRQCRVGILHQEILKRRQRVIVPALRVFSVRLLVDRFCRTRAVWFRRRHDRRPGRVDRFRLTGGGRLAVLHPLDDLIQDLALLVHTRGELADGHLDGALQIADDPCRFIDRRDRVVHGLGQSGDILCDRIQVRRHGLPVEFHTFGQRA